MRVYVVLRALVRAPVPLSVPVSQRLRLRVRVYVVLRALVRAPVPLSVRVLHLLAPLRRCHAAQADTQYHSTSLDS